MKLFLLLALSFTALAACAQSEAKKAAALALRNEAAGDVERAWDTEQYKWALEKAKKAFKMEPCYDAYVIRGRAYEVSGQTDDALADYAKAISLEPENGKAYLKRGWLLQKRNNKTAEALADFTKAAAVAPLNNEAWRGVAACYYDLKQWDTAQTLYLKALKLGADEGEIYYVLGRLNLDRKAYAESAAWFEKQLALHPTDEYGKRYLDEAKKHIVATATDSKATAAGCLKGNCNTGLGTTLTVNKEKTLYKRYTGQFVNGKRNGYGRATDSVAGNHTQVFYYEGNFLNDEKTGKGVLVKMAGNKEKTGWIKVMEWRAEFASDIFNGELTAYLFDEEGSGDTTAVFTGVYENSKQHQGTRCYKKFGPYFNGLWESDDWSREYATVTFTPAGTADKITGHFIASKTTSPFNPDGKYYSVRDKKSPTYPFSAKGPAYLYQTWWPQEKVYLNEEDIKHNTVKAEDWDKHEAAMERYRAQSQTSAAASPVSPKPQRAEIETKCISCNGSGWVDCSDNLGHRIRCQCPKCGGLGKVKF